MCGIFVAFSKQTGGLPEDISSRLTRALAAMVHRGPDGSGMWIDETRTIAVGHLRLAVIDLRPESNQPFWSTCRRYCIVFNGEIYNYLEIRAELEGQGIKFRTNSDTEVLLEALIHQGTISINKLNGMWAFVFIDLEKKSALVCRDRWGVKPLYFKDDGETIILSSEAKGIIAYLGKIPVPNLNAIGLFLKYSTGGECENSWFEGINRFRQACFQYYNYGQNAIFKYNPTTYWFYPTKRFKISLEEACIKVKSILEDAIKIRLRSDVPLGLSLSGGLDSSVIAWIISSVFKKKLQVFTAWFEPKEKSELPRAEHVAKVFGHSLHSISEAPTEHVTDDLQTCIYHLDGGQSGPAVVSYLNICREARKNLTVLLEGQGADELLCGYRHLFPFATMDYLLQRNFKQAWLTIKSEIRADGLFRIIQDWLRYSSKKIFSKQNLRWSSGLLGHSSVINAKHNELFKLTIQPGNMNRALLLSHRNGLANLLHYGDALSMAVGLETRCPFLDYRLVELGFSLPQKSLVYNGFGKFLLRTLSNNALPSNIVWPRRKDGFTNTIENKLRLYFKKNGLPINAVQFSIINKIFSAKINSVENILALPNGPFFRVCCVLYWLEVFYVQQRVNHPVLHSRVV